MGIKVFRGLLIALYPYFKKEILNFKGEFFEKIKL